MWNLWIVALRFSSPTYCPFCWRRYEFSVSWLGLRKACQALRSTEIFVFDSSFRMMALRLCLGAVLALCSCALSAAQLNTGNMRDLGYPEPNWYPIVQGNATAQAVVINPTTQHWGIVEPYTAGNASLCKWFPAADNVGRGSCKTDVSWIHAAVGLSKAVFDDPVVNYILRCACESCSQVHRSLSLSFRSRGTSLGFTCFDLAPHGPKSRSDC